MKISTRWASSAKTLEINNRDVFYRLSKVRHSFTFSIRRKLVSISKAEIRSS